MQNNRAKPSRFKLLSFTSVAFAYAMMIVCVVISEAIGNVTIPVGLTDIILFPIIWSLIIGGIISVIHRNIPGQREASINAQITSSMFIQAAVAFFVVKLGFIIGDSLPQIYSAGFALVFQEFGHILGTIVIALPVALFLGVKREAVGATFSIGREFNVAIISERYGMNSAEGRGVLAEYVIGTVIGALFIAALAGTLTSLGFFHPWSLAMGAGVGSGSMMSAAVAAITAHHPEESTQIAALAAASNLITTTVGTYLSLFISLPVANWIYYKLEPIIGRKNKAEKSEDFSNAMQAMEKAESTPLWAMLATVIISAVAAMIGNYIATGVSPIDSFFGFVLMAVIIIIGYIAYRILYFLYIPLVCWVSIVAILVHMPYSPTYEFAKSLTSNIALLSLVTPVLAFAGLSLAKDLPILRKLGWRIILVSLLANAGTFIFATLIAEFFH